MKKYPFSDLTIAVFPFTADKRGNLDPAIEEMRRMDGRLTFLPVSVKLDPNAEIFRHCGFLMVDVACAGAREVIANALAADCIPLIRHGGTRLNDYPDIWQWHDEKELNERYRALRKTPTTYAAAQADSKRLSRLVSCGFDYGTIRTALNGAEPKADSKPLKMAGVFDTFSETCFGAECDLTLVNPDNWQEVIAEVRPDLLLVESAWYGNGGKWQYLVGTYPGSTRDKLRAMIGGFRDAGIPTAFWNKEDPPHFNQFVEAAALFDYVFTTDENCIPAYREKCGHDRVFALPFSASPILHNPFMDIPRDRDVCFAGTYYANRFEDRRKQMDVLLDCAKGFKFDIYDRMYGNTAKGYENYLFPERFRPFIRGKLAYPDMVKAYHRYKVFLNTNSVVDSGTMFSRRVFELLACGTPVVTTPSIGIRKMFGGIVSEITDVEHGVQYVKRLLEDSDYYEKIRKAGIREVFEKHTYAHRLETIAEKLGLDWHRGPCPVDYEKACC